MRRFSIIIATVFLLTGCARVEITKVFPKDERDKMEGIRFYRPDPYLLVTKGVPPVQSASGGQGGGEQPAGGGGKTPKENDKPKTQTKKADPTDAEPVASPYNPEQLYVQVIWLPNFQEAYAIKPRSGIGTIDSTIQLKDGWQLTQFGGKIDTKVPETITAVGSLLASVAGAIPKGLSTTASTILPLPASIWIEPGLYRIIYDGDGHFTKLQRCQIDPPPIPQK